MNQNIIFNDDFNYSDSAQCWCFTGQLGGALLTVYCQTEKEASTTLSPDTKLDYELLAEEWIEQHDEPEDGRVLL